MTNNNNGHYKALHPNYVTGLTDGDGSVGVKITPSTNKVGWSVQLVFAIAAADNPANRRMFDFFNNFFGGKGRIEPSGKPNNISYVVTGLRNCLIIRNHLLTYPLITYKLVYFQL